MIPILSSANLPRGLVPGRVDRPNAADCPACLRPAGVAFDSKGRLFMANDRAPAGEIFVIVRNDGKSVDSSTAEELELLEKSTSVPALGLG